jgi:hypothetical protein
MEGSRKALDVDEVGADQALEQYILADAPHLNFVVALGARF